MRMLDLRMGVALLLLTIGVCGCAQAAPDFSNGITGLSGARAVTAADDEAVRDTQQKAIEAAALAEQSKIAADPSVNLAAGQLSPGDKVKLTVFGEEDLSGEFEI